MRQGFGSCGQSNKDRLQGSSCEKTPEAAFILDRASSYSKKHPIYLATLFFFFSFNGCNLLLILELKLIYNSIYHLIHHSFNFTMQVVTFMN